jgi:Putative auto-transporter adhesin, head GIN domain
MGFWLQIFKQKEVMKNTKILVLLLLFLTQLSCNKESAPDFLQTTGDIIKVDREINDFTEVELFNKINLFITQDTINKLAVEGGKNLLPEVITELKDGKLQIKNTNKFNFLRSYKKEINVYLSCKNLTQLTYRGAGKIQSTNTLKGQVFNFDSRSGTGTIDLTVNMQEGHFNIHTGNCDLILHGDVGVNYLYQAGTAYTNAEDLTTGYTFVTNNGTNDLKINVSKVLYAKLYYLGNIYYKGNPFDIGTEITDQGQLIKID